MIRVTDSCCGQGISNSRQIPSSQYERVQKMIPNCCNWDEGICLLLEMPCPQQLSVTRINCKYFRDAVLPATQRLYQSIMKNN